MKTFAKTLMLAAMTCVGVTATADAGPTDFGTSPDGLYGTSTTCPGGNCPTGYGANNRYGVAKPLPARTPMTGYASYPNSYGPKPYSAAQFPANCPGGVCPPQSAPMHMSGYRPQVPAANCTTGNCPPTAVRSPSYQQPRFSFLGLRW